MGNLIFNLICFLLAPFYDGVPQITQCPISPHTTFRYIMKATNSGTHWWHSHVGMQRADGAFGALIIREPRTRIPSQIQNLYDFDSIENVMMMQDWSHLTGVSEFNSFHHSIGDNKPPNILINGKGRFFVPEKKIQNQTVSTTTTKTQEADTSTVTEPPTDEISSSGTIPNVNSDKQKIYSVTSRKQKRSIPNFSNIESKHTPYEVYNVKKSFRYRFRLVNAGFLNCPLEISVDNHTILVIASDGHYIEPIMVDSLVSYAGERFDFIVKANQPVGNYWIRIKGLEDCDERFTSAHQAAILRYNDAEDELPNGNLSYDFQRGGFQMNSLNRGTGHVDSVAIVETTSLETDTPELLTEHTDYKFYVRFDFYDKDFPHFNHPDLYPNVGVANKSERFFGPQLNHISMKMPLTPFLIGREQNDESKYCNSSSLSARNINCQKDFCECTHVLQVPLNSTVEVIIIDEGYKYDANHPFHLHGHDFRVVGMERIQASGVSLEKV